MPNDDQAKAMTDTPVPLPPFAMPGSAMPGSAALDPAVEFIGFDLGHGDSAVASCRLVGRVAPEIVDVLGRSGSFVTAVARTRDEAGGERIAIGDSAPLQDGRVWVAFKSRNLGDPAVREPMRLFAGEVARRVAQSRGHGGRTVFRYVVGCPSGWSTPVRQQYEALLREAGLDDVQVIPESRAALLHAREAADIAGKDRLGGGVLIVDVGSSTTDFTLVDDMTSTTPLDFGDNALGAGLFDTMIYEHAIEQHPMAAEIRAALADPANSRWRVWCELKCRAAKEQFFSAGSAMPELVRIKAGVVLEIEVTPELMDQILARPLPVLGGLSWPDAFRRRLQEIRAARKDRPPGLVLLTGGGARMAFVQRLCEAEFPDAIVERGNEPQFAIARGLAWFAKVQAKVELFREEARATLTTGALEGIVRDRLSSLIRIFATYLADPLIERALIPSAVAWRAGQVRRLNDIPEVMAERSREWLASPEGRELLLKGFAAWFVEVRPELEAITNPLCDKYGIARTDLSIAAIRWEGGSPALVIDVVGIYDTIASLVSIIAGSMVGMLVGGTGLHLLMAGPLGVVIGFVLGAVVLYGGWQATKDWVADADIPQALRYLVTEDGLSDRIRGERFALVDGIVKLWSTPEQSDDLVREVGDNLREALFLAAEDKAIREIQ